MISIPVQRVDGLRADHHALEPLQFARHTHGYSISVYVVTLLWIFTEKKAMLRGLRPADKLFLQEFCYVFTGSWYHHASPIAGAIAPVPVVVMFRLDGNLTIGKRSVGKHFNTTSPHAPNTNLMSIMVVSFD